jgi:AraC family transcriptional regulator
VARAFRSARRAAELSRSIDALVAAAAALPPRPAPGWLEAARELLAERCREPPPLVELADRLGVHPVHLAQAFRARWGLTPFAFVRAHRVFNAVSLAHRGLPLSEVAYACGFADQSHMTRVVRAVRGLPPGRLLRARPAKGRAGSST